MTTAPHVRWAFSPPYSLEGGFHVLPESPIAVDSAGHVFHSAQAYADPVLFHTAARLLRREDPLHWVEDPNFNSFYVATKYADVQEIEASSATMLNGPRAILGAKDRDAKVQAEGHLVKTLVHMDGQEHRDHRRLVSDWFRPKNLAALQVRLDELAEVSVRQMIEADGRCDFATDIAMQYPLNVILALLGLPESDYPRMLKLTQEIFGPEDPEHARDEVALASMMETIADFVKYFSALTADRQSTPTEDLATVIANGTIDGQLIGPMEQIGHYVLIATAGHDTTSSAMSGGLLALIEHPEQLKLLQDDPTLMDSAIEEIIRWTSPVKHFMRTAVEDLEIRGTTIHRGQDVLLSYWSANFDEDAFADPYRFDVRRTPNKHLSFGFGSHYCLGATLARMEVKSLLGAIVPRLDAIELDGSPEFTPSTFVSGLKRLPIRYSLT